jgi:hypothetical protein
VCGLRRHAGARLADLCERVDDVHGAVLAGRGRT